MTEPARNYEVDVYEWTRAANELVDALEEAIAEHGRGSREAVTARAALMSTIGCVVR